MATQKNIKADTKATKTETKTDAPEVVKVADVARKLEMSPKAVRARIRRMYKNENTRKGLPTPIGGVDSNGHAKLGWNFELKDRKAVEALIASFVSAE